MKFMVLNGCNLNMLGVREPGMYGNQSYDDLCNDIGNLAKDLNIEVTCLQSNIEGELINHLQKAYHEHYDGVVLNAGIYSAYSYALYDAIKSIKEYVDVVEIHMTNMHDREEFRSQSVIAKACVGYLSGFGFGTYELGLRALMMKHEH